MATAAFVIAFLAVGAAVAFVAFSGGPSQAREAYLTKGRRGFRIAIPILYLALGVAVPALVLANRHSAEGSTGTLAAKQGNHDFNQGKMLFRENCWSCHTLKAAGARGVTGPNLDQIGTVSPQRVVNAILIGGTGDGRMPANLVPGACGKPPCHAAGKDSTEAEQVAAYVSQVAGK
ncbi:MAG: cytochrome [Thermoleophilaceae bacterium]|jgi:mono/diheme cytochrome c family protein|nr:cytochrome [Thermoleophilaceae bacterium]